MSRQTAPSRLLQLILLLITAFVLTAHAQVNDRPLIRGKVLDRNRAAVAGASVVAETRGRSASFSATTDESGEFSLAVEPGEYTVRVIAEGFSEASQTVSPGQSGGAFVELV